MYMPKFYDMIAQDDTTVSVFLVTIFFPILSFLPSPTLGREIPKKNWRWN
jgi:hypothetical protein